MNSEGNSSRPKDRYVRSDLPPADRGGLRRARLDPEVGIVSVANVVGLILSVLIALLLGAALMFPERF
ncbi:hypothetical protein AWC00_15850 [Mycobacterium conspicuum]|nr:hypothetical protein AWC00_15850 [Mycobacterium conspicuum]